MATMANQLGAVPRRILARSTGAAARGPPRTWREAPLPPPRTSSARFLSANPAVDDGSGSSGDGGGDDAPPPPVQQVDPKALAHVYNHRRAHYNRAVSSLRKKYAEEYAARTARDKRRKDYEDAKFRRETLERRRLKAIRSVENAQKQQQRSDERRMEWEEDLALTQRERDAKKELYRRARQKIVDELEAECHLWLTTPREVDRALANPTASQILWARPGGIIGAPPGPHTGFGDRGELWRYECHTWDARPTYKDPKQVALEDLEEYIYASANNDAKYWDKERVKMHEQRELQARLRSIVREEGRRSLLNKQRELMRDAYGHNVDDEKKGKLPPASMPAPKLDYLADYEAQDKEGVEILRADPRKFFLFEDDLPREGNLAKFHGAAPDDDDEALAGTTAGSMRSLGRPVGLRNPFFGDEPTAFPLKMGRDLPPDTRTEKEKKRDERQERMRAAAEEAALAAKKGMSYEVAMAAEEDLEDGSEDVDYDQAEEDAENELWADQEEGWGAYERKVFEMTPPAKRLTTDDVKWLEQQLAIRRDRLKENLDHEVSLRKKEVKKSGADLARVVESVDDVDEHVLGALGYDVDAMTELAGALTPEQTAALEDLEFEAGMEVTEEEMATAIRGVPGLTEEQVQGLVKMEMTILRDERLGNLTRGVQRG